MRVQIYDLTMARWNSAIISWQSVLPLFRTEGCRLQTKHPQYLQEVILVFTGFAIEPNKNIFEIKESVKALLIGIVTYKILMCENIWMKIEVYLRYWTQIIGWDQLDTGNAGDKINDFEHSSHSERKILLSSRKFSVLTHD